MLTGAYLAVIANKGAIITIGKSIRLIREAHRSRLSSFSSSWLWREFVGRVFPAKLAPRTTKISGTATPPLCWIALVTEFLIKVPSLKNNRCNEGIEATSIAANIAQSGGFMKAQTP